MRSIILFVILPFFVFSFTSCPSVPNRNMFPVGFTVDIKSPNISLGSIEMQTDKAFSSGINKINANVSYYPEKDAICLNYKFQFYTYHLFWDLNSRQAFLKALADYKTDYSNRALNKNSLVKKRKYGSAPGFLGWQSLSVFFQYTGSMDINLGYYFKDKSPYFTITQRPADYKDQGSNANNATSAEVTFYFTRAQADEFAVLLDEELLKSLSMDRRNFQQNTADVDEYDEY